MIKSLSHILNNWKFAFINYVSQLKFKALKSIIETTVKEIIETTVKEIIETTVKAIIETTVKTVVETTVKAIIVFKI